MIPKWAVKILASVAKGLMMAFIGIMGWVAIQVWTMNADVAANAKAIEGIEKRMTAIETKLDAIDGGINDVKGDIGIITDYILQGNTP
jgi:TRAP-type C4-dicarboxylate transport system permease small subunit